MLINAMKNILYIILKCFYILFNNLINKPIYFSLRLTMEILAETEGENKLMKYKQNNETQMCYKIFSETQKIVII